LNDRPGEAIGPLRRALAFGGQPQEVLVPLARAFMKRKRYVAAFACLKDALAAGAAEKDVADDIREVETKLGPPLTAWKARLVTSENEKAS
jgi:hypothetical protein